MAQNKTVEIIELSIQKVVVQIIGISPLIVHRFTEKARKQIQDTQNGAAKSRKHARRNPEEEYEQAKHISLEGWEGFPVSGFKKAMVRAAKSVGIAMTDARVSFFVEPDDKILQLVRINGKSDMRTDMVRLPNGSPDVRYRPEYKTWSASLTITFNEGVISLNQIFQLIETAGFSVGIGEGRPEKQGDTWGRFQLVK